jgi:Flp pilus assembly protein TadD
LREQSADPSAALDELRRYIGLLKQQRLTDLTVAENVELALMLEEEGSYPEAWERLQREADSPKNAYDESRLAALVPAADFWVRRYRDEQLFEPAMEKLLRQMDRIPEARVVALRFRLDQSPKALDGQPLDEAEQSAVAKAVSDFCDAGQLAKEPPLRLMEQSLAAAARTKRPEIFRIVVDELAKKFDDHDRSLLAQAGVMTYLTTTLTDDSLVLLKSLWKSAADQELAKSKIERRELLQSIGEVAYLLGAKQEHRDPDLLSRSIKIWEKVLEHDKDDVSALNLLAFILADQGEYQRALSAIGHAASLKPDDGELADSFGIILALSGQPTQALEQLQRAQLGGVRGAAITLHVAYSQKQAGNLVEARRLWDYMQQLGVTKDALLAPLDRELWQQLATYWQASDAAKTTATKSLTKVGS